MAWPAAHPLWRRAKGSQAQAPSFPRGYDDQPSVLIASEVAMTQANLTFANDTLYAVDILWLDYKGVPKSYGVCEPGQRKTVYSYLTHPWTFVAQSCRRSSFVVSSEDGCTVVWPRPDRPVVHLIDAPSHRWTRAAHLPRFGHKSSFTSRVRTLLLCHNRLAHHTADGGQASIASRAVDGGDDTAQAHDQGIGYGNGDGNVSRPAPSRSDSVSSSSSSSSWMSAIAEASQTAVAQRGTPCQLVGTATAAALAAAEEEEVARSQGRARRPHHHRRWSDDATDRTPPAHVHIHMHGGGGGSASHLGCLPLDLIVEITSKLAPEIPIVRPVLRSDVLRHQDVYEQLRLRRLQLLEMGLGEEDLQGLA